MTALMETSKFGPTRNAAALAPQKQLFATTTKRRKMLWSNNTTDDGDAVRNLGGPAQTTTLHGLLQNCSNPDVDMVSAVGDQPGVTRRSVRTKRGVAHLQMQSHESMIQESCLIDDPDVASCQELTYKVFKRPIRTVSNSSTVASICSTQASISCQSSGGSVMSKPIVGGTKAHLVQEMGIAPLGAIGGRTSIGYYDELYMNEFSDHTSGSNDDYVRLQPLYLAWVEAERKVQPQQWVPSFVQNKVEQVRLTCIESIFKYVNTRSLGLTTLHLTTYYTNRLFNYYVIENQDMGLANFQCLVTATGAAMRMAVKMQEKLHHVDAFRSRPNHLWEDFDLCEYLNPSGVHATVRGAGSCKKTVELLNQMERVHLKLLERESMLHIPVASDFLDQYLLIGGWPEKSVDDFRGLGQFILARTLFLSGKKNGLSLTGTAPSKLAAGALALAVKIINSTNGPKAYEFWTKKLESFTHLTFEDIQPTVQGLSKMLRHAQSPTQTDVLRRMFPSWAQFSWC